ncbi:unnamed protein product [Tenebrio molitor]|nr:unnamed protein product [Tenebrio molitor]
MLVKFLFLLFPFLFCEMNERANENSPEERIVGGDEVPITSAPFVVSVRLSDRHKCGGSIGSNRTIITAAHCTDGLEASSLSVMVGSSDINSTEQIIPVEKFIQHSHFNRDNYENDVSILRLKSQLTFDSEIQSIKLSSVNFPPGTEAQIYGWGIVKEGDITFSPYLKGGTVKIVDRFSCQKAYETKNMRLTREMMCAGIEEGGVDTCPGDSGGPLVVNNSLVGITSFGFGCGDPKFPGVYVNAKVLSNFIRPTIIRLQAD